MPSSPPLSLYDHLSEHGPMGLREIAKDRFGGDVIEARQQLSYLEGEDLIEQTPAVYGLGAATSVARKWKVIDPK